MISFIKGKAEIFNEREIILENNGIGYKIFATETIFRLVQQKSQEKIKVYTHMNVNKENEIALFGFSSLEELKIFEKLISVAGVGPKGAISLLNAMKPAEIALAIITSDTKSLSKGQGIGKKMAERIALELRDKIDTTDAMETISENFVNIESSAEKQEAIEALIVLGFSRSEAMKAIGSINEDLSADILINKALKFLSK